MLSLEFCYVGDHIALRRPRKFESSHNMLEVLNYNRSVPLFLSRHDILLSSFVVPDDVFIELQYNDLMTNNSSPAYSFSLLAMPNVKFKESDRKTIFDLVQKWCQQIDGKIEDQAEDQAIGQTR